MATNHHSPPENHHTQSQNGHHKQPESSSSQVAVVMVPLPAQGHLNQLLHLSRHISAAPTTVYYVGSATHLRQAKVRSHDPSSLSNIIFHELPTPPFENPPPNPNSPIKFPSQIIPSFSASTHLRRPIQNFVREVSRKFRRVVVIYDFLMTYVVQDVDAIDNAESYCFRSLSAFTMYSFLWEVMGKPDLPDEVREMMRGNPSPDGCFPPEFDEFRNLQRVSRGVFSGDLYNTSRVIEGAYLDLLAEGKLTGTNKLWAIGPFNPVVIKTPDSRTTRHECLDWLDKQEPNSVIFVSFGTTSSLSDEQIQELAIGLERSNHKFIWVVRDADKGDIFSGEVRRAELPEGFEERVRDRGIVVRDWAPQLEILGHSSTGVFMSHCGWNSCLESISNGVPIATWPMHSDQPRNAFLVTNVLGIGVEVRNWEWRDEVVSSEKVEGVVRNLLGSEEGDEIRRRAEELGVAVKSSVMENGESRKEMDNFIAHITRA